MGERVSAWEPPTRSQRLPDGDLSEREWQDADDDEDDEDRRPHADEGDPSSLMQGRLAPMGEVALAVAQM